MLDLVRSLKTLETNFNMYIDAPTKLSSFFFALDHTDYARWIPVRLRAMLNLTNKHPDMARAFAKGMFTVQKTKHVFACIAIDHAHERNNVVIKGDGEAVCITDNPSALRDF